MFLLFLLLWKLEQYLFIMHLVMHCLRLHLLLVIALVILLLMLIILRMVSEIIDCVEGISRFIVEGLHDLHVHL
jgi:hypothetical protein